MSSFALTISGFFLLLFIFVSSSSYLYPRKLDSSRNCPLTASSSDKRRRRRIVVNLLFHCDRLLFVCFLVAIVFASSTDAIDSAFEESCEGQYYVLFSLFQFTLLKFNIKDAQDANSSYYKCFT